MGRFVGVDYSTTETGVAIVDGDHWQVFSLKSKPTGDTLDAYYERILGLARDIVATIDPREGDVIGIEGIAFAARGQKVDRLHYAWHRTVEYIIAAVFEVPVIVTTNQVKQLATGKGSADKDAVLLAAERRIPQARVANNNEADAVWIAVGASVLAGSPVISLPAAHMPKGFRTTAA